MLGCIDPAVLKKLSAHEEYQDSDADSRHAEFCYIGECVEVFDPFIKGFRGGGITVLGHHDWILCRAIPDMV